MMFFLYKVILDSTMGFRLNSNLAKDTFGFDIAHYA